MGFYIIACVISPAKKQPKRNAVSLLVMEIQRLVISKIKGGS